MKLKLPPTLRPSRMDPQRAASSSIITAPPVPLPPDMTSPTLKVHAFNFPRTTRARLRHDREQLAYLSSPAAPRAIAMAPEVAAPAVAAYDAVLAELGGAEPASGEKDDNEEKAGCKPAS